MAADLGERFLEFRGDKSIFDLEKDILALPDNNPDKEDFYDLFVNEFYCINTIGIIRYDPRFPVLSDAAQSMFDRIYKRIGSRSYFAKAFKAMLDNDEIKCLKFLEKHLIPRKGEEDLAGMVDELSFCEVFLDPFKNRFDGFYKKVLRILNKTKTDELVKLLCEHMDEYYASEDPDRMAAAMYPVVQKYPDSNVANKLLGYAHYEAKRWGSAIACFEKAEDEHFLGVFWLEDLYFFKGWAYSKLKEHKKAAESYEWVIESGVHDEYTLNNLGYEYYLMKQYSKALKIFEQCLKENRGIKYAANNYVRTLLALGKVKEAKAFIKEKKYKVAADLVRKAELVSEKNRPIKEEDLSEEDAIPVFASEKAIRKVAAGQQFSSEKLLEEELSMRIDSGRPVFGLNLKIFRRHGEYGRQYIIPVGRLDLLAEDQEGNLYIIELKKDQGYDDSYKQIASYLDWFEKNHKTKKKVYGIICLNNPTEKVVNAVKKDPRIRLFNYSIMYEEIK